MIITKSLNTVDWLLQSWTIFLIFSLIQFQMLWTDSGRSKFIVGFFDEAVLIAHNSYGQHAAI